MIKNIVFDIGNVLVRFQPDEAMREIGIEENKIAALAHATYENPVWVELDRGVIPENEIIDEMVKVAPQYEEDIRRFFKEGKAFVVKAFDYAADWIKELKSRGYKVYLLSNYGKYKKSCKSRNDCVCCRICDDGIRTEIQRYIRGSNDRYRQYNNVFVDVLYRRYACTC